MTNCSSNKKSHLGEEHNCLCDSVVRYGWQVWTRHPTYKTTDRGIAGRKQRRRLGLDPPLWWNPRSCMQEECPFGTHCCYTTDRWPETQGAVTRHGYDWKLQSIKERACLSAHPSQHRQPTHQHSTQPVNFSHTQPCQAIPLSQDWRILAGLFFFWLFLESFLNLDSVFFCAKL